VGSHASTLGVTAPQFFFLSSMNHDRLCGALADNPASTRSLRHYKIFTQDVRGFSKKRRSMGKGIDSIPGSSLAFPRR
jgi:hypothetical protein